MSDNMSLYAVRVFPEWPNGATHLAGIQGVMWPTRLENGHLYLLDRNTPLTQRWEVAVSRAQHIQLRQSLFARVPDQTTHIELTSNGRTAIRHFDGKWAWLSGDCWVPFVFDGKPKGPITPRPTREETDYLDAHLKQNENEIAKLARLSATEHWLIAEDGFRINQSCVSNISELTESTSQKISAVPQLIGAAAEALRFLQMLNKSGTINSGSMAEIQLTHALNKALGLPNA